MLVNMRKSLIIFLLLLCSSAWSQSDNEKIEIHGSDGNDVLTGSYNSEYIYSGKGNDIIDSGPGADILYGGSGADTYIVRLDYPKIDEVMDFDASEGDSVLIKFDHKQKPRSHYKLPKKVTYKDFELDNKGVLKLYLNKEWLPLIKIQDSDMLIKVTDKSDVVSLIFKKRF